MKTSTHLILLLMAALAWTVAGCDNTGNIVFGDDDDASGDDDDDDTGDDDTGDDDTGDDDTGGGCPDAAVEFDFEDGDGGFGHQSSDGGFADPWELGTPVDADCTSGATCWATRLEGEYDNCEAGELVSPIMDLSGCDGSTVQLVFMHLFRFEEGQQANYDGGAVQMSTDGGDHWVDVEPDPPYTGFIDGNYSECPGSPQIDGHQGWSNVIPGNNWDKVSVEVGSEYFTDSFRFRFLFGSDRGVTEEGWYLDDIQIVVE